jgi:hypothetical protein
MYHMFLKLSFCSYMKLHIPQYVNIFSISHMLNDKETSVNHEAPFFKWLFTFVPENKKNCMISLLKEYQQKTNLNNICTTKP